MASAPLPIDTLVLTSVSLNRARQAGTRIERPMPPSGDVVRCIWGRCSQDCRGRADGWDRVAPATTASARWASHLWYSM